MSDTSMQETFGHSMQAMKGQEYAMQATCSGTGLEFGIPVCGVMSLKGNGFVKSLETSLPAPKMLLSLKLLLSLKSGLPMNCDTMPMLGHLTELILPCQHENVVDSSNRHHLLSRA